METVFGTLLVAIAVGLLASTLVSWENLLFASKERTSARLVARQEMERCLSLDFEELELCDTAGTPITLEVVRTLDGVDISSTYDIEIEVGVRPEERIKSVTVTTKYGPTRNLSLQVYTLVYQTS